MPTPTFQYRSLNPVNPEIRLVHLLHPTKDGTVHCKIEHVSLKDNPTYNALSYAWGNPHDTRQILLNDTDFQITKNLEAALRQFQQLSGDRAYPPFWIDALCINQLNDEEKSAQVQRMGNIFSSAENVFVWLGEEADNSHLAMQKLGDLGKRAFSCGISVIDVDKWPDIGANPDHNMITRKKALEELLETISIGSESDADIPLLPVQKLFQRAFWERLWVVQEVVLAKKPIVACGGVQVDWQYIDHAITFFYLLRISIMSKIASEQPEVARTVPSKLVCLNEDLHEIIRTAYVLHNTSLGSYLSLAQILHDCVLNGKLQASNPKDKIFALLGLLDSTKRLGINSDYSRSCRDVYTEVARRILRSEGLIILNYSGLPAASTEVDVPSWVPDWSVRIRLPFEIVAFSLRKTIYSACGESFKPVDPSATGPVTARDSGVLTLLGVRVDTICISGRAWPTYNGVAASQTFFNAAAEWLANIKTSLISNEIYNSPEKLEEALCKTPIADRIPSYLKSDNSRATDSMLYGYRVVNGDVGPPNGYSEDNGTWRTNESSNYLRALDIISKDRRPFTSFKGYLGLGPTTLLPRDLICILHGATTPFILRAGENGRYRLVGHAYVHGIMDGEYMDQNPDVETFEIY